MQCAAMCSSWCVSASCQSYSPHPQAKEAALEELTPGQMEVLERNPREMDRLSAEIDEMEETLCDSIRDALRNKQDKAGGEVARKRSRVGHEVDGTHLWVLYAGEHGFVVSCCVCAACCCVFIVRERVLCVLFLCRRETCCLKNAPCCYQSVHFQLSGHPLSIIIQPIPLHCTVSSDDDVFYDRSRQGAQRLKRKRDKKEEVLDAPALLGKASALKDAISALQV